MPLCSQQRSVTGYVCLSQVTLIIKTVSDNENSAYISDRRAYGRAVSNQERIQPQERQLDAVRHEDRRQILFALRDAERWRPSVSEFDGGRTPVGEPAIPAALYHRHLPKLAEAGLLTWDSQQNQVTLTTLGSQLPAELIDPSLASSPTAGDRKKPLD